MQEEMHEVIKCYTGTVNFFCFGCNFFSCGEYFIDRFYPKQNTITRGK